MVSKRIALVALFISTGFLCSNVSAQSSRQHQHRIANSHEVARNLVRATGHGWGRGVHYYDPGFHSCYYNPWSSINTPRFAFTTGEPDCYGLNGCASNPGSFQQQYHSFSNNLLPIRDITEPQFPPSQKSQVDEDSESLDEETLLDDFSSLSSPAISQYNPRLRTNNPHNTLHGNHQNSSAKAVSVLSNLQRK